MELKLQNYYLFLIVKLFFFVIIYFNVVMPRQRQNKAVEYLNSGNYEEAYNLLCTCFGVPPTKFDFEYVDKEKKYHLEMN